MSSLVLHRGRDPLDRELFSLRAETPEEVIAAISATRLSTIAAVIGNAGWARTVESYLDDV